ncbi:MAG: hypothetical protein EAZ08_13685 [Cytophagales bacterium]|nr:MAG: hypothetical protein EAZ08_13685 [Cytophagales bacterium]
MQALIRQLLHFSFAEIAKKLLLRFVIIYQAKKQQIAVWFIDYSVHHSLFYILVFSLERQYAFVFRSIVLKLLNKAIPIFYWVKAQIFNHLTIKITWNVTQKSQKHKANAVRTTLLLL